MIELLARERGRKHLPEKDPKSVIDGSSLPLPKVIPNGSLDKGVDWKECTICAIKKHISKLDKVMVKQLELVSILKRC
jgi:hypothetical protein